MGVICFGEADEEIWHVGKWVYGRFMEDVRLFLPDDPELDYEIVQSNALDGLHFKFLEENHRPIILKALKATATAIAEGRDLPGMQWTKGLDKVSKRNFRIEMPNLLAMIEQAESAQQDPGTSHG